MLLLWLASIGVLDYVPVPWWAFYGWIFVGFGLVCLWNWLKIWAANKMEN